MKKSLVIVLLFIVCINANAQRSSRRRISLIPQPVSMQLKDGSSFILPEEINLIIPKNDEVKNIASLFAKQLAVPTGYKVNIKEESKASVNSIFFTLISDKSIPEDGYQLNVTATGIILKARKPAGIFHGVQTLLQLLPSGITSKTELEYDRWDIPSVSIEDHPRFGWRGLMLDVTRHFFTVQEVKDFIDQMVKYKFNLLHLHLTDDQGWRLQIKSLPKLTEVGAWRVASRRVQDNFKRLTKMSASFYFPFTV